MGVIPSALKFLLVSALVYVGIFSTSYLTKDKGLAKKVHTDQTAQVTQPIEEETIEEGLLPEVEEGGLASLPSPRIAQAQATTPTSSGNSTSPAQTPAPTIIEKTVVEQPIINVQGVTKEYTDSLYETLRAEIQNVSNRVNSQPAGYLATIGNIAQVFSKPATSLSNTVVSNGSLSGTFTGTITGSTFSGSSITAETGDFSSHISLASISSPAVTTNKLYNIGGALYWNGSVVATGATPWVQGTGMVRPANTTDQVLIGATATTTTAALEINGNLAIRENNSLQIGSYRALTVDDGDSTVMIGRFSSFTPTGYGQVGIGRQTLNDPGDDGYYNVAIGDFAFNALTGGESVAIGYEAGRRLTDAYSNVAIGSQAMANPLSGDYNVALGYRALLGQTNYEFSRNTAIGNESLANIQNGSSNTALGSFSGYFNLTGNNNTYIGESAGNRFLGSSNILLGYRAGFVGSATQYTGSNNILIGTEIVPPAASTSGYLSIGNLIFGNGLNGSGTTVATGAIGIGTSSPYARLSVTGNAASTTPIFAVASSTNTPIFTVTYDGKVGVGTTSPASTFAVTGTTTIAGGLNIATQNSTQQKGYITFNGGNLITVDNYNWGLSIGRGDYGGTPEEDGQIAIGIGTLKSASSGYSAIAIGNLAGENAYLGYSIAIGDSALKNSANSSSDIAIGRDALRSTYTSSGYNSVVGEGAAAGNNGYSVQGNSLVGYRSMNQNTDGSYNSAVGQQTLEAGRGDYNVAIGYFAGRSYIAPDDSIFIGKYAGGTNFAANTGTNNIFIGREVAPLSTTQNNFMTIANLIYGTDITGTGTTLSIGNVGIGTSSPRYRLHVASTTNNEVAQFEGVPGQQCTITAGTGIACTSDEKFKTNILEVASSTLEKFLALKPVSFNWKTNPDGSPQLGFIAQDVEKLFPELVSTDSAGNKSVFYSQFVSIITKAVQVIEGRLVALEKKVDALLASAGNSVIINPNAGEHLNVKTIVTEELRIQPGNPSSSGITITDRGNGSLICIYFENGSMKTTPGSCGATSTNTQTQGTTPQTPNEPAASTTPTTPTEPGDTGTTTQNGTDGNIVEPTASTTPDTPTEPAPVTEPEPVTNPASETTPEPVVEPAPESTPAPTPTE